MDKEVPRTKRTKPIQMHSAKTKTKNKHASEVGRKTTIFIKK